MSTIFRALYIFLCLQVRFVLCFAFAIYEWNFERNIQMNATLSFTLQIKLSFPEATKNLYCWRTFSLRGGGGVRPCFFMKMIYFLIKKGIVLKHENFKNNILVSV